MGQGLYQQIGITESVPQIPGKLVVIRFQFAVSSTDSSKTITMKAL
jgi:hypothetical protein